MSFHDMTVISRRQVRGSRTLQLGGLVLVWILGEAIVRLTHLSLPGSIVGMVILLAMLMSGKVSLGSWRLGARWFLSEMLLFFVPAALAILNHHELFGWLGLKVLAVIVFGIMTVMAVTALVVDLMLRGANRRREKTQSHDHSTGLKA
jgi:holin-like protein